MTQLCRKQNKLLLVSFVAMTIGYMHFPLHESGVTVKYHLDKYRDSANCSAKSCSRKEKTKKYPSVILVGIVKCGTGAISFFLETIYPELTFAHYTKADQGNRFSYLSFRNYLTHFDESCPCQRSFEYIPGYFEQAYFPKEMKELETTWGNKIKFLLTVRNPIGQFISHYRHKKECAVKDCWFKVKGLDQLKKLKLVDFLFPNGQLNITALKPEKYYTSMLNWLEYFPRDSLHIIDGDNLIGNPKKELIKVENFLDLNPRIQDGLVQFTENPVKKGFYCIDNRCPSETKGHKYEQELTDEQMNILKTALEPWNAKFCKLAQLHFAWC